MAQRRSMLPDVRSMVALAFGSLLKIIELVAAHYINRLP